MELLLTKVLGSCLEEHNAGRTCFIFAFELRHHPKLVPTPSPLMPHHLPSSPVHLTLSQHTVLTLAVVLLRVMTHLTLTRWEKKPLKLLEPSYGFLRLYIRVMGCSSWYLRSGMLFHEQH